MIQGIASKWQREPIPAKPHQHEWPEVGEIKPELN